MASQIAHIVYAKKYLSEHPMNEMAADLFFLGCVFPDIRRIDKSIKRKDTHLRFDPIDLDFENITPFEAGWKFHLYCDMRREEILNDSKFYEITKTDEFLISAAKLLEDELVYDDFDNWEKIVSYFNNPPSLKENLPVSLESYKLWYAVLAKYLERKPDEKSFRIVNAKQQISIDDTNKVMNYLHILEINNKAINTLREIKDKIINST